MSFIKSPLWFVCFPVLLQATLPPWFPQYVDLGPGLCGRKVVDGKSDVAKSTLYKGKGRECQQLCDETTECHGYSTTKFSGGFTDQNWDCSWSNHTQALAVGMSKPIFIYSTLHEAQSACTQHGPSVCGAITCASAGVSCTIRFSASLQPSTGSEVTYVPHPNCFEHDCILWEDDELQGGGQFMGGASCLVKDRQRGIHSLCSCPGGHCPWEKAPDCVSTFTYDPKAVDDSYEAYVKPSALNVTGCTTTDYNNRGWCSTTPTIGSWDLESWRPCTKLCQAECYWQEPSSCVPIPQQTECWAAPKDDEGLFEECVPQFWYQGTNYEGCTMVDSIDGVAWCSHNYRFATAHTWSRCTNYCDTAQYAIAAKSSIGTVICVFVFAFFCRKSKHYQSVGSVQGDEDVLTDADLE